MGVGGEIFRTHPELSWGPHSLLYNGYRVSCRGLKRHGRGIDDTPPSSAEVKEKVEVHIYIYYPSGPSWPVLGELYFFLPSLGPCCMKAAQRSTLFQFAVRPGALGLDYCIAASFRLLLSASKEDAADVFLLLADTVTSNEHLVHCTSKFCKLSERTGND